MFGGCLPEGAVDCSATLYCTEGFVCHRGSECLTEEAAKDRDEMERRKKEEEIAEKKQIEKEKKEAERKRKIEKETAAHEKEDGAARTKLDSTLTKAEQERQQTSLDNSAKSLTATPGQKSPALLRLEALARGEDPFKATSAPTTASTAPPALNSALSTDVKRLEPPQTGMENRTIAAPVLPAYVAVPSTFLCGDPPNQSPCPTRIESGSAPASRTPSEILKPNPTTQAPQYRPPPAPPRQHPYSEFYYDCGWPWEYNQRNIDCTQSGGGKRCTRITKTWLCEEGIIRKNANCIRQPDNIDPNYCKR